MFIIQKRLPVSAGVFCFRRGLEYFYNLQITKLLTATNRYTKLFMLQIVPERTKTRSLSR